MNAAARLIMSVVLLLASVCAQTPGTTEVIDDGIARRLKGHVAKLASPEHGGRFGPGAEVAREYIESQFAEAGLEPVGKSWRHPFARSGMKGINLVGVHPGTAKPERHIIVSAHYDHLGRRGDRYYPGACDNASGVAAMLELARALKGVKTRRTVVFVAFDLEERGLLGSFAWAARPPVPLEQLDFFVTIDMLGRKALGVVDDVMFALGWEWTPEILPLLKNASAAVEGVDLGYFHTDVAGDRSDFVAFKRAGKPHLFFSTGENPDYHRTTDTVERLDVELLTSQTKVVGEVVRGLVDAETLPTYGEHPERHLIEFESMRSIAKALMKSDDPRAAPYKAQAGALVLIAAQVIKKGEASPNDRRKLLKVMRQLQASR